MFFFKIFPILKGLILFKMKMNIYNLEETKLRIATEVLKILS